MQRMRSCLAGTTSGCNYIYGRPRSTPRSCSAGWARRGAAVAAGWARFTAPRLRRRRRSMLIVAPSLQWPDSAPTPPQGAPCVGGSARLCRQYSHPSRGGERLCQLSVRHCPGHSKGSSVQSRRCRHAAFGRLGGYSALHSYHPLVMQARDEQPKRGGGGAFMAELNKKVGK